MLNDNILKSLTENPMVKKMMISQVEQLFNLFKKLNEPKKMGGMLESHYESITIQAYYNVKQDNVFISLIPLSFDGKMVRQLDPIKVVEAQNLGKLMEFITDNTSRKNG